MRIQGTFVAELQCFNNQQNKFSLKLDRLIFLPIKVVSKRAIVRKRKIVMLFFKNL